MGGLLHDNKSKDAEICNYVLREYCDWWDEIIPTLRGINICGSEGSLEDCSLIASNLFDGCYFPKKPGPFKRVAAFLVLGRLFPFLEFSPRDDLEPDASRWVNDQIENKKPEWQTRAMIRFIPALFAQLSVRVGGKNLPMEWKGFPSQHYELEFHEFIRWIDSDIDSHNCGYESLDEKTKCALARKIMAVSLSIEGSFYCQGRQNVIPGHELHDIDTDQYLDLFFDTVISPKMTIKKR